MTASQASSFFIDHASTARRGVAGARALVFGLAALGASSATAQSDLRWLSPCLSNPATCDSNVSLPAGSFARKAMLPADVDRDGDVDVLSVGPGLALLRNHMILNGAPGFGQFTPYPGAFGIGLNNIEDGVLADFDLDGDLDLAVVQTLGPAPLTGDVRILVNSALPNQVTGPLFADSASLGWIAHPVMAFPLRAVAAGDFDGDGDPDLVVAGPNGVRMFRNDVIGGTAARTLVDVTGSRVNGVTGDLNDVAVADVDNDGDKDLVIAGGTVSGSNAATAIRSIALNPGPTGQFVVTPLTASAISVASAVEAADLNGDGKIDLAFGHRVLFDFSTNNWTDGELMIFMHGASAAGYNAPQVLVGPYACTDLAAGDIDEDGLVDLVMSCQTEEATVAPAPLQGRTRLFSRTTTGAAFADVTLGRVDDDAFVDGNSSLNPSHGGCVGLADLDLDLDLDVMVGHQEASYPGVFQNFRWQLDVARGVAHQYFPGLGSDAVDTYQWDVPYVMTCDPSGSAATPGYLRSGMVFVSFAPPTHLAATPYGYPTVSSYVTGPLVVWVTPDSSATFNLALGPCDTAIFLALQGSTLYAQAGIVADRPAPAAQLIRLTGVVQTTLQ
jgi:hypothetical protein